ncbi:hypothetical protein LTR95_004116 [Oleoguttula sp. CCFEE 5521]
MAYAMNPDLRLTEFGHTTKHLVDKALQAAVDTLDRDEWDPCSDDATRLLGAHVALIMEKAMITSRDSHLQDIVCDFDMQKAIDAVEHGPTEEQAPGREAARAASVAKAKNGGKVGGDAAVLREQILANARALVEVHDSGYGRKAAFTELVLKSVGTSTTAMVVGKTSQGASMDCLAEGAACESDLAALQSLDRKLKGDVAKQWK